MTKKVQDRIKTNRRKLIELTTAPMNHNLNESIEISTSCQKTIEKDKSGQIIKPNNISDEINPRTPSLKAIKRMDIKHKVIGEGVIKNKEEILRVPRQVMDFSRKPLDSDDKNLEKSENNPRSS